MANLNNASCESFMGITLMGDYNLGYLTLLEKENLDTVVLPYGFTVASPCLPTRVCKSTKTNIDYILPENIDDGKSFVFDTPFNTDHFCSVLFTGVSAGEQKCLRLPIPRFDKTKYMKDVFCQKISEFPWSKIYQCSNANDMFNMFVNLLSNAVEKYAPFQNVYLEKKLRNSSTRLGLTWNSKTYYVNGSWPMKNTPRFHHPKIGLLIVNYDQNYRLS